MARTKRSDLPSVTDADRLLFREQLRRTPNGGWAWKCHYCGRYACDCSLAGRYLCRCHGGSTPRQRCPYQDALHRQETGQGIKMPGRPIKLGRYARRPGIPIVQIIGEAYSRQEKHRTSMREVVSRSARDVEKERRRQSRSKRSG